VVQAQLEPKWSPEQIAAHLREVYPDRPGWHLCHETIYQALYRGVRGGLTVGSPSVCAPSGRFANAVGAPISDALGTLCPISASTIAQAS
jgi:hypothetical protein